MSSIECDEVTEVIGFALCFGLPHDVAFVINNDGQGESDLIDRGANSGESLHSPFPVPPEWMLCVVAIKVRGDFFRRSII